MRYVRVDPHVGLANLIAVTAPSTVQRHQVIIAGDVERVHSRFSITGWLSPADGDVYYGILALATASTETTAPWEQLKATEGFAAMPCRVVRCSWRELARTAGCNSYGKSTGKQLRASLLRLGRVRQSLYERNIEIGGTQWLAWRFSRGGALIVLNPRASWVLGLSRKELSKHPVTLLSLEERTQLNDAEARVLHSWLSAWARPKPGRVWKITKARLAGHVWKDNPGGTTSARRQVRFTKLLARFDNLGGRWHVTVNDGVVEVRCESLRQSRAVPLDDSEAHGEDEGNSMEHGPEAFAQ